MKPKVDGVAEYRKASWDSLAQVDAELEHGDLEKAAQALWESAAHAMKAAAVLRGWPHGDVRELMHVVTRLIKEEGGPVDLNTNAIIAHSFDRRDRAWEIPLLESELRYCREPVMELVKILEGMD